MKGIILAGGSRSRLHPLTRAVSKQLEYKCTDLYEPATEIGIAWNDPALAITWPFDSPLSDRDRRHPTLAGQADRLPIYLPADR